MLNQIVILRTSLLLAVLCLCVSNAPADEVYLDNGDVLHGAITRMEDRVLSLETDYSETVEIQVEKIQEVKTEGHVDVHLKSGEILIGTLAGESDGRFSITSHDNQRTASVNWDEVATINPIPPPPSRWSSNVAVGVNVQSGNTQRTSLSLDADAMRETAKDRFSLKFLAMFAQEDGEKTAQNTYSALKYDYFFKERFYGYLTTEMLMDKFKDLNLRSTSGAGAGWQVLRSGNTTLDLELGLSFLSEDFDEGEDDSQMTLRLGSKLDWPLSENVHFINDTVAFPSTQESQFQIRNEASIITTLSGNWSLKTSSILEYDSDPPDNVKKADLFWLLSLQYSF